MDSILSGYDSESRHNTGVIKPLGSCDSMERGQVVRPSDVRQLQADTMSALPTDSFNRTLCVCNQLQACLFHIKLSGSSYGQG